MVVEIFTTDVSDSRQAEVLLKSLKPIAADGRVTFDLEDIDKIMRIESQGGVAEQVIRILDEDGYSCKLLYRRATLSYEIEEIPR
ncbi:hypothetical protein SAMN05421747_12611 [Parapedobacter composti]|uniref:Uncharacterized protein n=1 Tax=Parapedobacter composti TaxID=623281 RepID=A0A1I1MA32_9SPHI|nr:hypothetical protein [Parapedobacter composti]SFC78490.1 hypothetical protein SAMN05421747_12611 [Parapedobacter composti]